MISEYSLGTCVPTEVPSAHNAPPHAHLFSACKTPWSPGTSASSLSSVEHRSLLRLTEGPLSGPPLLLRFGSCLARTTGSPVSVDGFFSPRGWNLFCVSSRPHPGSTRHTEESVHLSLNGSQPLASSGFPPTYSTIVLRRLQGAVLCLLPLTPSHELATFHPLACSPTSALSFAPVVQALLPPTGLWKWLFDQSSFQRRLVRWASEY